MSIINVSNLTFSYDGSCEKIFENVSFSIDSDWKLGLIGRNGKGKTTFLNLLMGKYEYSGKIISSTQFDYFPFEVSDKSIYTYEVAQLINPDYEIWKIEKEISMLDMDLEILYRPFETLSKGEQTRVLLAILFTKENNFLLIDEPTNHLDLEARNIVSNYLNKKKSFILVSHDRLFLDECIDHVLSINKSNIEVQQGNFSSWWENKKRIDNYELNENEKLKKDINRLEKSAKKLASWSFKVEASKNNFRNDCFCDKGYIGHKAAKMMKRSMSVQNRKEKAIEDKTKLLKNIEKVEDLKIHSIENRKGNIIEVKDLSISYNDKKIFKQVNFSISNGDRLLIKGRNGSGKSSIIKLLLGENITYKGNIYKQSNIKISYISQDTSHLKGSLRNFIENSDIDETLFKSILRKLDFKREQFEKNIENYSEGQKKKILIARSLSEKANLYIWDEPLNYIDIFTRMQIEEVILSYMPTLIFVEHDKSFAEKIANKILELL